MTEPSPSPAPAGESTAEMATELTAPSETEPALERAAANPESAPEESAESATETTAEANPEASEEAQPEPRPEPNPNHYFQALGYIEGEFVPGNPPEVSHAVKIGDRIYSVFIRPNLQAFIVPGEMHRFTVYPKTKADGSWWFQVKTVRPATQKPLTFQLKGNWGNFFERPLLQIRRNLGAANADKTRPFYLPLNWADAPSVETKGFYLLEAVFEDDQMRVIKADGPHPQPAAFSYKAHVAIQENEARRAERRAAAEARKAERKAQAQARREARAKEKPPFVLPTLEEILAMATPAKVEVTCKVTTIPGHVALPNNQGIEFYLSAENNSRILIGQVKLKQWNKLLSHGFENWIAAIAGSLGETTERGTILENPSIQVFERKLREPKPESDAAPAEATTPATPPAATPEAAPAASKGEVVEVQASQAEPAAAAANPLARPGKATDAQAKDEGKTKQTKQGKQAKQAKAEKPEATDNQDQPPKGKNLMKGVMIR